MKKRGIKPKEMGKTFKKSFFDPKLSENMDQRADSFIGVNYQKGLSKGEDISDDISAFRLQHYTPPTEEKLSRKRYDCQYLKK